VGPRAYKIPSDEEVVSAITQVMGKRGIVRSQKLLKRLVDEVLRKIDPGYGVSLPRVRKLAIASGFAQLEMKTRRTDGRRKGLKECPVCGARLARIKNKTIEDKTTSFELKCLTCGYFTGAVLRVPTRYVFVKRV